MKKLYFGLLMTAIAFSSCEMSDQESKNPGTNQQGEVFSFETQHRVDLQAEFGPMSINGLVQVFTSDPTQYVTEDGKIVDSYTEGDAVYNTYANQDGRAIGSFDLPDHVKKVWVSVHAIGVGGTVECPIENGQIRLDLASKQNVKRIKGLAPNANANAEIFSLPTERLSAPAGWTNFQTLVKWWDGSTVDKYGKVISDPNNLISWDGAAYTERSPIDYSDLQVLLKALWKGDVKPSGLDNSRLCVKDVSLVNTTIHAKGDKKGTKLWFRFMDEHAWNQNVMGYYYYPEGQEASLNKKTMKKYLIIPNASKPNHYPYSKPANNAPYVAEDAPAQSGMSIQMLFEDPETGVISEVFPAGYTIGFFCLADSYNVSASKINVTDSKALFSNDALNSDGRSRFICLSMTSNDKDYLVYGLEDGTGDKSYEDILFIIDAEEPDMIQEENRVTIESVTGTTTANTTLSDHKYNTYAFEDNYEEKRDYDLNDVVIEHHRIYNSKKTSVLQKQLTSIIDYFSINSRYATFDNAFAFQYAKEYSELGSNITIKYEASKNGADWTTWAPKTKYYWTNSAHKTLRAYVLYNSKDLDGVKYFRVTRTFNGVVDADEVREAEQTVYPFIIPKWDTRVGNSWNEIHLPSGEVTALALNKESNDDNFHFVDANVEAGMLFPYAINISQIKTDRFEPSAEGVRIDVTYPRFADWVKSNGQQATDWFRK